MTDYSRIPTPPEILYHYTSQDGLIGMLESKKIWASSIHYLNDSREFSLALDMAREDLEKRMDNAASKGYRDRLETLRDSISTIETIDTCVCCFSERGDSLSQWRGYGGGKAGFSVGFSREWFARVQESLGCSLIRCIYSLEKQRDLIHKMIAGFLEDKANAHPEYWHKKQGYGISHRLVNTLPLPSYAWRDFPTRLARIAPQIKHETFKDEKEWRLVVQSVSLYDLRHRAGESMLIPYYRIPIGDEETFDSIKEIVVGPTPHPDLSTASLQSLVIATKLLNSGNSYFEYKRTNIPFRNW